MYICVHYTHAHTQQESFGRRKIQTIEKIIPFCFFFFLMGTTHFINHLENQWKGDKAKELTNGYEFYCIEKEQGQKQSRNRRSQIGIEVDKDSKEEIAWVMRLGVRLITIKQLVLDWDGNWSGLMWTRPDPLLLGASLVVSVENKRTKWPIMGSTWFDHGLTELYARLLVVFLS